MKRDRAQDFAVQHPVAFEIGRVRVPSRHKGASIGFGRGRSHDMPFGGGRQRDIGGNNLRQFLTFEQFAIRDSAIGRRVQPLCRLRRVTLLRSICHCAAARSMSSARAAAAALRSCGVMRGVVMLPTVPKS